MSILSGAGLVVLVVYQDDLSEPVASFVWGILSAMMNVSFPSVLSAFFEKWLNINNKLTQLLSRGAYATYLLHFHFVFALTGVWAYVLSALLGYDVLDPDYELSNEWMLVAGGAFVSVVGLPLTWSVCWCICLIPGLRNIL